MHILYGAAPNLYCVVPEKYPYLSYGRFFLTELPTPPENSNSTPHFSLTTFAFVTPSPLEFPLAFHG